MNHYSHGEWMKYIKGDLAEAVQKQYEDHLYECDYCLQRYMSLIEQTEDELMSIDCEQIVGQLVSLHKEKSSQPPMYARRRKLIHYALAAGFTILLTFSGVFFDGGFFEQVNRIEDESGRSIFKAVVDDHDSLFMSIIKEDK